MKKAWQFVVLGTLLLAAGCTTKKYVNQQVVPIINKVNTLDQLTAESTHQIAALNDSTTQQISDLEGKTSELEQKSVVVAQESEEANQRANGSSTLTEALVSKVKNLDNYRNTGEISIHFSVEGSELDEKAKADLDHLAATAPSAGNYVFTVIGNTDSAGPEEFNYELSQRRAGMTAAYLSSKFHIAPYRIFRIGLGPDVPVAANTTKSGRARNRRVDIAIYTVAPATRAEDEESSERAAIK